MLRASSANHQEDTVLYMQHIVLSLSMRVPGGLLVHSLSENSSCVQLYLPEDEHLRLETCGGE